MEPTHLNHQRIYHDLQKLVTVHRNALQNAISTGREFDRGYQAGMSAVIDRVAFVLTIHTDPEHLEYGSRAAFCSDGSVEWRKANEDRD